MNMWHEKGSPFLFLSDAMPHFDQPLRVHAARLKVIKGQAPKIKHTPHAGRESEWIPLQGEEE
jgi:hypothetical protein